MPFNNLTDLENYIKKQIASSMVSDVAESIKEVEIEMIQKDVFNPYTPFLYQRRSVGGIDDPSNMNTSEPNIVGNQISISISNDATGFNDTTFKIAPLIEYGDAKYTGNDVGQGEYDFKFNHVGTEDKFLSPRPFIEDTVQTVESTGLHIETLKKSLQSKGFTFK